MASELEVGKIGVGTAPIADSKLDIAGAGTQRLYVRETGSTVRTKMLTTTSKGAVGTETNHPLELQTNDQTRVTIDANGAVGLARTATSGYRLDVHGRSGYEDVVLIEGNGTNMGPRINLTPTGTGTSRINATANDLALQTGGSTRLTISSTGLASFSNGIAFQSATTGSGTGVGYTLENYEYGTFTMGLSGTTETIPSGNEIARYYRIGNLVWISWYSGPITLASSSGAAQLTGLPFEVANNNANYSVFSYTHGNAVDGNSHGGYFIASTKTMRFIDAASTGASTFVNGSNRYIMVTGVYETADA